MNKVLNNLATVAVLASATVIGACEDGVGIDGDLSAQASVSFAAVGGSNLFGDPTPPQNPQMVGGHAISVTNVDLKLSELELEGTNGNETEIKGSTFVVAVPTNGSLITPVTAAVAAGTYNELEMKVQTVRIRGTYDGQPFDVTVTVDESLETRIDPPLVVSESGTANATIVMNITSWFRNSDGSALDLTSINATVLARLAANIESSFDAFDDDDRSGRSSDDD